MVRKKKNIFLVLDWAKAFDSISPDGLIVALRRFGIPDRFCATIRAIYSGRKFVVRDAGQPLTEVTLHAIWEVIWMPLALVGESLAAFYLAPQTKAPYLPSLCRVKVVVLSAHNVAE